MKDDDQKVRPIFRLIKSKPLLKMSKDERDSVFDEMFDDVDRTILKEAREQDPADDHKITVAFAVLETGGRKIVTHSQMEYGDDEGIRAIEDFIRRNRNLLEDGETLTLEVGEVEVIL
jgi:hypothetical protein